MHSFCNPHRLGRFVSWTRSLLWPFISDLRSNRSDLCWCHDIFVLSCRLVWVKRPAGRAIIKDQGNISDHKNGGSIMLTSNNKITSIPSNDKTDVGLFVAAWSAHKFVNTDNCLFFFLDKMSFSIFIMDVKISLLLLLMVSGFISRTAHVTRKCHLFQIILRVYVWKFAKENTATV